MHALLISIEKLRLNSKLLIGFGLGLLIALAIGINSIHSLRTISEKTQQILDSELLGISHIKEANINLIYIGRSLRAMIMAQTLEEREKARARLDLATLTLGKELGEARTRITNKEEKQKFDEFDVLFDQYKRNLTEIIALLEKDDLRKSQATSFLTSERFQKTINGTDDTLTAITKVKEKSAQETAVALEEMSNASIKLSLILLVSGLLVGVFVGSIIGRSISHPIERLRDFIEGLAAGKVDETVPYISYKNELGNMARSLQTLQDTVQEMENSRWIKAHSAEIAAALQQTEDSRSLAQLAISRMAQVLNAGHGLIYLLSGDNRLNLLASYGYRERKHLNNSYAIGEGLIGQCAMEKVAITLSAPQDYIQINSGLGEAPPACISVLPIMQNECLLGVLEIASFQQFSERQIALLDTLMPILAISMEIMDRNQRTRDLLVATQEQAVRMEKQAAQLEEQTVEMEAQQAELLETENWFRSIIETAPDGMLVVNEKGSIVLSNPQAEALFGYEAGQLLGIALSELMQLTLCADVAGTTVHTLLGRRKDGHEFAISLNRSGLPALGKQGRCMSLVIPAA